MQWCYERDSPVLWIIPRHKLLPALAAALGCRTGRHPSPDIGGTIGHWIEFPVVALIVKVILVVLSQFLKAFRTNYFLRVVPTKWRFFDIFSDMLSGIRTLFHTLSAILSGIQSGISSGFFCGWGPASNTLIIKLNMFVVVVVVVVAAVAVAALCCCCCRFCYPCSFFLSLIVAKTSSFFWNSWSKEHRKYRCFLRLGSPKPRYLRCCLPLVEKGIYRVFWTAPIKHWYLRRGRGGPQMNSNRLNNQVQQHVKTQMWNLCPTSKHRLNATTKS